MKDLRIFIKDVGFDTGVLVSTTHLSKILKEENIDFEVVQYKNDRDLLDHIENSHSKCINLQVPSFSDMTMDKILQMDKNIVLSIHSTMCNLQVEEGALSRIVNWSKQKNENFRITCPSLSETQGFNTFSNIEFIYLPNTFSYNIDKAEIEENINRKSNKMDPIKVSLFCAYRPFKNMITQVVAVAKLAKRYPIELHLFNENRKNPIFENILQIAKQSNLKLVLHEQRSNKEYFKLIQEIHVGLQVSLSETFSYVAFEHMICGIPIVGSSSIPFASKIGKYSDVNHIESSLEEIILSQDIYKNHGLDSMKTAGKILKENKKQAIQAVQLMIHNKAVGK